MTQKGPGHPFSEVPPSFVPEIPEAKSEGGRPWATYQAFRSALADRPGEWAAYPGSIGVAGLIRKNSANRDSHWFGFECAQRTVEGKKVLFVRYTGPQFQK